MPNIGFSDYHSIIGGTRINEASSATAAPISLFAHPNYYLYKTVARPAMMYSDETWAVKKAQENMLDVAEMMMFRSGSGWTTSRTTYRIELSGGGARQGKMEVSHKKQQPPPHITGGKDADEQLVLTPTQVGGRSLPIATHPSGAVLSLFDQLSPDGLHQEQ